ncbi:MAG: Gfo/Idh/MocA family protein [Armatimonadota bacterium]
MKMLNVGLVGAGFMGKAHSNAYRAVPFFFPDLPAKPVRKVICDNVKDLAVQRASDWEWEDWTTSYKRMVQRDDVDVVDICTPNVNHLEVVLAAAEAGKHILCEKPLARTADEAKKMAKAVEKAGVINMVSHNYRRCPAVSLAKKMIDNGDLGEIYHFRATYLQDWIVDPNFPLVWRLKKHLAGSGALGDLVAHSVDLALYLVGEIDSLSATVETFIKERPVLEESARGLRGSAKGGRKMGKVTVDDAAIVLARFKNGTTIGTFEATRFALGRRNQNRFEINGSKGSLVWDLERMNELQYYNDRDPAGCQGFKTILATDPTHPYMEAYWPPAHNLGYEHSTINTVRDFLEAVATRKPAAPDFEDGVKVNAALDTVLKAAKSKKWERVRY